jgi:hypothetical protein
VRVRLAARDVPVRHRSETVEEFKEKKWRCSMKHQQTRGRLSASAARWHD